MVKGVTMRPRTTVRRHRASAPGATRRIQLAIDTVGGGAALASLLDVNASQVSRWRSGTRTPSSEMLRRIIDVDHVVARTRLLWASEVALDWLRAPSSHLGGAVPLEVLELRGPAEVLDALDAVMSGAYA